MEQTIDFQEIYPFQFRISYNEIDDPTKAEGFDQHRHNQCEIYVNLTGDVSFMVENHIYPIASGNVIITRPFEHHHCIYHSNALHKHFWILFSSENNEALLDIFFRRKPGENNLISLTPDHSIELTSVCRSLLSETSPAYTKYLLFFKMIDLLGHGVSKTHTKARLSPEILCVLDTLNQKLTEPISVSALADSLHMSLNTFERHFKKYIGMSPATYIRQKRMSSAASLLAQGCSVREACEKSGFPDYSHFISLFKKTFGMTPLVYQKQYES